MSQMSGRTCPKCGISITHDQRFCTNCGTVLEAQPQPPSQYGAQPPSQSHPYPQQVPPYAQQQPVPQYAQQQQQQVPQYMQQAPQKQSPIAEAFGALGLLFLLRGFGGRRFAGYRPQRQRSSCCGCLVLLVVLFLCLGVPSLYYASKTSFTSFSKGLNFTSGSSNSSNSSLTTQPTITTVPLNEAVNFFGVDLTIVNAQQSQAFLDDSSSSTTGMVRLNLNEDNKSTSTARFLWDDQARLILPDKTSVAPVSEKEFGGPDGGVSRPNWLDFPVPTNVQVSQLTLQLGGNTKAQESIPLTGKANLAQYLPKTAQPNIATQYAGLTWTITTATASPGFQGQQADKGMQYVIVTLKVDNPTPQTFRGYYGDYIRLKSGDATQAPNDGTLPLGFDAGSSGSSGNVIFTMPSGSTSFTLIFLNTPAYQFPQATANFQVG